MTIVALSGTTGNVGQVLRPALLADGVRLRSAGERRPPVPVADGEDVMHGNPRDPAAVDQLLVGTDPLIHLDGASVERPLPEIIENNLIGLHAIHEGARRHAVRRVVFVGSSHAVGMYPVAQKRDIEGEFRPDRCRPMQANRGRIRGNHENPEGNA